MLNDISCVLHTILVKIKYRSKINLSGILRIPLCSKICISNGKIEMKRVKALENVKIFADGGTINIGNNCFFNRNVIIVSKKQIMIGDHCVFGPNVCIYDHDHCFSTYDGVTSDYKMGEVQIGKNCWIGAGTIILRNTTIGEGCIIGAGVVVKGDIPPFTIVTAGNRELKFKSIEH